MFIKLATRNLKRQLDSYSIYFITVTLTVALIFAINNVFYSKQLQDYAEAIEEMKTGLIIISILIALIVAFILSYATSFMLKLRKREFGTYLTLGMTRKNIMSIFICETMIMAAVALALGIFLGLFIYQGMMMILTKLMELDLGFASYSMKGLILTIVVVCGIFIISSVASALYLSRVSIYTLIRGEKRRQKIVKYPVLWMILTLASLAAVIASCFALSWVLEASVNGEIELPRYMLMLLLVITSGIILYHIGLSKSLVNLLLRSKTFTSKGTNTFILRQLSANLGSNSIMAGILAFLISFSVLGANVSFVQKVVDRVTLDKFYPFDITVSLNAKEAPAVDLDRGEQIISKYADIERKLPYNIYNSDSGYLHSFTAWTGDGYSGLTDSFMSESDFNTLLTALGRTPVSLKNSFLILSNDAQVNQYDFSSAVLDKNGIKYSFSGIYDELHMFNYVYFIAVVPDAFIDGMAIEHQCEAIDLKEGRYDAENLHSELTYKYPMSNGDLTYYYERSDFEIKEYTRIQNNSSSSVLILGAIYSAVVFVLLSMAVLALKTLAGLSEDKQRYETLFRLGTGTKEQNHALFWQTFSFFFLPFALPILLTIPTALICGQVMRLVGFAVQASEVYANAVLIAIALCIIYILYFMATYLLAKRNVVHLEQ